ncbi:MAG: ComEC/Rec2 family competence protein [Alphaproteobacteria bacterium]
MTTTNLPGVFMAALAAERDRWALWLPVGLGVGVGVYFALPVEPAPWPAPLACAVLVAVMVAGWARAPVRLAACGGLVVALGFAVAQGRVAVVDAPVVAESSRPAWVEGRVVHAEPWRSGVRLVLDRLDIERLKPSQTPARVRVVAMGWHELPAPGTRVELLARLGPPAGPAAPGAFDFARYAYFERLGGTGFAYGAGSILAPPERDGLGWYLSTTRHDLSERIRGAVPGTTGAVAAALLTGERAAIPESINDAMRDSGLYHLLSISGLHLSLVAGIVFFVARAGLALIEPVAVRYPIKKWAAVAALAATALYLGLSGMAVPTLRAFLMTTVALTAILLDRSPFSMRLVAVAAAVLLLAQPDSLLGASFQLSFAAVVALIAVFEEARDRRWFAVGERGFGRRVTVYLAGVALTSLVAGTATAPFAAYHFDRFATWGVAGNLAAVPITGVWVMPWGLAALVLAPVGLERLALVPMGWGIDVILAVARFVAAWPGAALVVPSAPFASLLGVTAGGLWLTLWRGRVRWLGAVGFVVAGLMWAVDPPPDMLIEETGKIVAARGPDDQWAVSSRRKARFVAETWLRQAGETAWARWPRAGEANGWIACDDATCVYTRNGRSVAIVGDPSVLDGVCPVADVLIVPGRSGVDCPGVGLIIDRTRLARLGAHALWLGGGEVRVATVAETLGDRPWTRGAR